MTQGGAQPRRHMPADRAKINVRGGHGGNGCVSFRREKYVPKGGPDGGDGGHGANVVLRATRQARDLSFFRRKVHLVAPRGQHGSGGGRHGADGVTLVVDVPVGTEVCTPGGDLVADLVAEGVEDEVTLDALRRYGCTITQGFVHSPPLPGDELPQWIADHAPAGRAARQPAES